MPDSNNQDDQGGDIDALIKAITDVLTDWKNTIDGIAKDLAKLDEVQKKAEKDAQEASKKLNEDLKKAFQGQKPPQDPKKASIIPDFITKNITKNGLKLGDWGSVKPDVDIDIKKMQVKKVVPVWTFEW